MAKYPEWGATEGSGGVTAAWKKYMLREVKVVGGSSGLTAAAIYQRSQKFSVWNLFCLPVAL